MVVPSRIHAGSLGSVIEGQPGSATRRFEREPDEGLGVGVQGVGGSYSSCLRSRESVHALVSTSWELTRATNSRTLGHLRLRPKKRQANHHPR